MHNDFQQEIGSIKVLMIEDNKLFSYAIKSILELENIIVKTADNGESAYDILDKEDIDVILLDIMLGDNMNGFEFLNLLKSNIRLNQIPVIITSALVQDEKIYEGLSLGAIDYLVKPFRTNELLLKVKNFAKLVRSHKKDSIISDINEQISNLDYDYQLSLEFISLVDKIVVSGSHTTIKEIVKLLKTNSSRLGIIIKKYHNTTPVKYILIRRLLRANLMIRNSNISIIQIAEECGFQTVTYFCTSYKKHYGKTPLKARQAL
jgi:DNA-binding response OmpR family regulator